MNSEEISISDGRIRWPGRVFVFVADDSLQAYRRMLLPFSEIRSSLRSDNELRIDTELSWQVIDEADVIVLWRYAPAPVLDFVMEAKARGKRVIMDVDLHPELREPHPAAPLQERMRPFLEMTLSNVDVVTVPTPELAFEIGPYNARTQVIRTRANPKTWISPKSAANDECVTLCWQSLDHTIQDLEPALEAVATLMRDDERVRLMHFSTEPLPGLTADRQVIVGTPDYEQLPDLVSRADIGIVPRNSSAGVDVESPDAVVEFGLAGLPVVVSDTAPHRRLTDSFEGISIAEGTEGWLRALRPLVASAPKRKEMGGELSERIRRSEWVGSSAGDWSDLLSSLAGGGAT